MVERGKCQNAQNKAKTRDAVKRLKRLTRLSVPYECQASSSKTGAVSPVMLRMPAVHSRPGVKGSI
jgi:hypothetical protein